MLQLWRFFPKFRDFCASLGTYLLSWEFSLLFLAYSFGVAFFAPSVFSPLLSLFQWLALCVLAAGLHLWWSGCNFGVLPGVPSCLSLTFLHLLMCLSARMATNFVSHHFRFDSGLYAEAGILGGSRMWVCGLGPCRCTLLVVPIHVCGFFSVAAELGLLSLLLLGVG